MMATKHKSVIILSALEVEEKMGMSFCLVCDEPFTQDRALKHKGIWFKAIDMNEEVDKEFSHKPSTLNILQYVIYLKSCMLFSEQRSTMTKETCSHKPREIHWFNSCLVTMTPSNRMLKTTMLQFVCFDPSRPIVHHNALLCFRQ
jgi:hypothetical protein